jgi:hypothetical protein
MVMNILYEELGVYVGYTAVGEGNSLRTMC